MKRNTILKKYFINKGASCILALLVVILGCTYFYMLNRGSILSVQASSFTERNNDYYKIINEANRVTTYSQIILVVFSITGSALISTVLIEKKKSNKIVEEIFIDDFFTSNKFLDIIDDENKNRILDSLLAGKHFEGCKEKAEMLRAVIEKINLPVFDFDFCYEKCDLDIVCEIKENYIEKTVLKHVRIKSLEKTKNVKDYNILSISASDLVDITPVEIKKVRIDGTVLSESLIKKQSKPASDSLNMKRGYSTNYSFCVDKTLNFSNKKPIDFQIEYTTRCPLNDISYFCRMPYPCKEFDFKFHVKNKNYHVNPSAFGFIDDAKDSPNSSSDRQSVSIKFEDWIFPLDGVCILLEKNVAKQERV